MEIFEHFDTDFSGEVNADEFADGLKRLGIYLTAAETQALLSKFSGVAAGGIAYKDFIRALGLDGMPVSLFRVSRLFQF